MTKEERQQKINDEIEAQYEWSSISDEDEAKENVKECFVMEYLRSELEENDFLELLNDLGYEVENMTDLRETRARWAKQKAYREAYKARKKAKREAEKAVKRAQKEVM